MNVLKAFKKPSTTQIELGGALLKSVTGEDYVRYSDAQISDIFRGKKNVGDYELLAARSYAEVDYLQRFKCTVIPLLDANEIASVVAAMRRLVADDTTVRGQTIVDPISGLSKEEVAKRNSFVADEFLAGLFLYILTNVRNRGTSLDANEVNGAFAKVAQADSEGILLIDSWNDAANVCVDLWRSGPNTISLAAGDIFTWLSRPISDDRRIVVIPVDTSFCMRLSSNIEGGNPFLVSEKTLHGKFLVRWEALGGAVANLEQRVKAELCGVENCESNDARHPVGTIAVIEEGQTSYCLLAVSEHDEFGNTQSVEEDIRCAIEALILFYDRRGMGYPLLIPLVGTGRSRSGLSPQRSLELILDCLMSSKSHVQGEAVIVVLPNMISDIDIEKARTHCGL